MKSARAEDAWRRSTTADRGFRVARIRAIDKPPLADLEEELANGMTIVCGLNGVGKTTVLRLVEGAIAGADAIQGRCRPDALAQGSFLVDVDNAGEQLELALGAPLAGGAPGVTLLDAFDDCARLLALTDQPNFDDLLQGVDAREYTPEERERASYVVGRQYDAIEVYEVEEPGTDEETILPFFDVTSGGASYGSAAMGLGELAALAALWNLDRVDAGSVVLLEEPETFLSSRSTVALMDVLAERVHERRLYAIVTTHSLEIVARAPLEIVRLLSVTDGGVVLRRPPSRAELEHLLGAYLGQARVVLIEDRTARVFLGELISRFAGLWGQSIELAQASGVSPIVSVCRNFPANEGIRLVGVIDGDQTDIDVDDPNLVWPLLRLPGNGSPDSMLRDAAVGNIDLFASRLDRTRGVLEAGLEQVAGRDAHDWFPDLGEIVGLDFAAVLRAAIHCWLAVSDNGEAAKATVDELVRLLTD